MPGGRALENRSIAASILGRENENLMD